jgi:crotonobetainyl-CoA:carnitine CoA-transferase CaiB-like acyl-CoA transferase
MTVLSGIRVLDFGRYIAGPYCATLLGYLGAEVIRIERPGGGEDRYVAPLSGDDTEGALFFMTACNKKSMTLRLGTPEAADIVKKLVGSADVVVANLPPGALARLGLDYAALTAVKPDIILTTITAFGTSGPIAARGGFDGVGQAMSGAMHLSGTPGFPVKSLAPYVDYSTASLSAFGTMAAIMERSRSGKGQHVEASLLRTGCSVFGYHLIEQAALGADRTGTGNRVQTNGPSDVFATADGHVLVHTVGDGLFRRWAELIGEDGWLSDPRFASDQLRGDHRDELCERVQEWCGGLTTEEVLSRLGEAGIPCGPVLTPRQTLEHPQVQALDLYRNVAFNGKTVPVPDLPVELSETESGIAASPPVLGADTDEVLAKLGYGADDIEALRAQGIV